MLLLCQMNDILLYRSLIISATSDVNKNDVVSPFEWVPEQLSSFLTNPRLAKLLGHPGY